MAWRYMLRRLIGDGTETSLHTDVPLTDVEITVRENGVNEITATISDISMPTVTWDRRPYLEAWSTAVYAIPDRTDNEFYAFIVDNVVVDRTTIKFTGVGFMGYLADLPMGFKYTAPGGLVQAGEVMRVIWGDVQSYVGGNLNLKIEGTTPGVIMGRPPALKDGQEGGKLEYDDGDPYILTWPDCTDLLGEVENLVKAGLFYHERHRILNWDTGAVEHSVIVGNETQGRYRTDCRFVEGENIVIVPSTEWGADYASQVICYGAGEGVSTVWGEAHQATPARLRRSRVILNKAVRDSGLASTIALRELKVSQDPVKVTQLVVRQHTNADIFSLRPGDLINIFLRSQNGFLRDEAVDVRVKEIHIRPDELGAVTLSLATPEVNSVA